MSENYSKFGEKFKQFLIKNNFHKNPRKNSGITVTPPRPDELDFIGCSEDEIREEMNVQNIERIPEVYRQFLMVMGKQPAYFLIGIDATYAWLKHIKNSFYSLIEKDNRKLRAENKPIVTVTDDVFVFFSQQSHSFIFFYTNNEEENPPVYRYINYIDEEEEDFKYGEIEKISESLSDWFYAYANAILDMRQKSVRLMEEAKKK